MIWINNVHTLGGGGGAGGGEGELLAELLRSVGR